MGRHPGRRPDLHGGLLRHGLGVWNDYQPYIPVQVAVIPQNPPYIAMSGRVPPSIESTTGLWTVHAQFSQTDGLLISRITPSTDPSMAMDENLYIASIYIDPARPLFKADPSAPAIHAYDIASIPLRGSLYVPAGGALNIEVLNYAPDTRGELFLVNVYGQSSGQMPVQVSSAILDLGKAAGFGSGSFRS
jgi:hypothetical protein